MKTKQAGWRFVGWWVLAAVVISIINTNISRYTSLEYPALKSFLGFLTISFLQWLVIRPYLKGEVYWLFATLLGFFTTFFAMRFFTDMYLSYVQATNPQNSIFVIGWSKNTFSNIGLILLSSSGIIVTFFQWLVLRKEISRSIWWLVVNPSINIFLYTIGFLFKTSPGNTFGILLSFEFHSLIMGDINNSFLYSLLKAVCIGILLMWLLQKPLIPENELESEEL